MVEINQPVCIIQVVCDVCFFRCFGEDEKMKPKLLSSHLSLGAGHFPVEEGSLESRHLVEGFPERLRISNFGVFCFRHCLKCFSLFENKKSCDDCDVFDVIRLAVFIKEVRFSKNTPSDHGESRSFCIQI